MKITLLILLGLMVAGCGGGSSSGGGNSNNVATCFVKISEVPPPPGGRGRTIIYKNNCSFPVNIGTRIFSGIRDRKTIQPGGTFSKFTGSTTGQLFSIIACKFPAIPIVVGGVGDTDIGGTLTCS